MNYFTGIKTLLVLKARYRELCKLHHPDLGGDLEIMKAVNVQYEAALKHVHDDKGETLTDDAINIERDLMNIINKIVALKGIIIEVTGRWIWITGGTYPHRNYLREIGCFWAHKKLAWYWRPADAKVNNRHPYTLEQIRSKFGCISIETTERQAIA